MWTNPLKERYAAAHDKFQAKEYPASYRDHGPVSTQYPDVRTANGLTNAICKYINWSGYRATRINISGRLIEGREKQPSGTVFIVKKWLKSSTRKGTADISATINSRSIMLEIKCGSDRPSEDQLKEQERERRAGGQYEFIHTIEEFFTLYDKIVALPVINNQLF